MAKVQISSIPRCTPTQEGVVRL